MNIVVLPGYNCQDTLEKVVCAIPNECVDDIIYVDDYSSDKSTEIAQSLNIKHIIRHTHNIGYGGNQKTLYSSALKLNTKKMAHSLLFLQKLIEILHNSKKSIIFAPEMKKILG